jgi:hypothetical protein
MDFDFTSFAEDISETDENKEKGFKLRKEYIFVGCVVLAIVIIFIIKSGNDISSVTGDPGVENIDAPIPATTNLEVSKDPSAPVDSRRLGRDLNEFLDLIRANPEAMQKINKEAGEQVNNFIKR